MLWLVWMQDRISDNIDQITFLYRYHLLQNIRLHTHTQGATTICAKKYSVGWQWFLEKFCLKKNISVWGHYIWSSIIHSKSRKIKCSHLSAFDGVEWHHFNRQSIPELGLGYDNAVLPFLVMLSELSAWVGIMLLKKLSKSWEGFIAVKFA
jgi:hypothetical protein